MSEGGKPIKLENVVAGTWDMSNGTGYIYISGEMITEKIVARTEALPNAQVVGDYDSDGVLVGIEVIL